METQKARTAASTATVRARPREEPVAATVVAIAATTTAVSSQTPRSVATKTSRSEPKRALPTACPVATA